MSLLRCIATATFRVFHLRETATRHYLRSCNHTVQAGPFRGMNYVARAHCSALAPKISGSYERELLPCLNKMLARRPDVFIDVGAAEGYYAVGAAFAGWSPRIVAFESDESSRKTLRELMQLNHIPDGRVELREACTPEALSNALADAVRPALIIDAEGFEALLVDPLRVPALAHATILLEYHDFILPGLSGVLIDRMRPTHHVEIIEPVARHANELVGASRLLRQSSELCRALLTEFRPARNGWIWFEPKSVAHQPTS